MAEMKYGLFGALLVGFIVLIIGISFLSSTADTTSKLTDTYTATNDSFSGVNDTDVAVIGTSFDVVSVSEVRNSTGSALTLSTDYNVSGNNVIVYTGNATYYADYTYRSSSYISNNSSRQISGLIPLFFALAILGSIIAVVDWDLFKFGK